MESIKQQSEATQPEEGQVQNEAELSTAELEEVSGGIGIILKEGDDDHLEDLEVER